MKIEEKFNAKLWVEGNDDQHVVWALCKQHNIPETFDVIDCGGYSKLLKQVRQQLKFKSDEIHILGIIIDADSDVQKRWGEIRSLLNNAGYQIDNELLSADGFIRTSVGLPRLGVWLMPNNDVKGAIEGFIEFLIPEGDNLLPEANRILSEIECKNFNNYDKINENQRQKALIHTWLAWQESPGTPMGSAITKSYLTTHHDLCQRFTTWLNNLFNSNHSDTPTFTQ
jgi:hypothetical protein